jgi:hypothetical protein
MTNYSFSIKNSEDRFKALLRLNDEFLADQNSTEKAESLALNSWHLIEWVYADNNNNISLADFRETLYPQCESLKLMHDIANGTKHRILSRPKADIKDTRFDGDFCEDDFGDDFNTGVLEIELNTGQVLRFGDEIEKVIIFWKTYFEDFNRLSDQT